MIPCFAIPLSIQTLYIHMKTNIIILTDRNDKTYIIDVCSSIKAPVCFAIDKVRKSCLIDGYNPSFIKARKV